jgi:transposase
MRDYLSEINQGLAKSEWLITCELFAPYAPEQNPVEDIWLQAKRFIRENWFLCKSFAIIKELFLLVTHCQYFDFPKIDMYGSFAQKPELVPG